MVKGRPIPVNPQTWRGLALALGLALAATGCGTFSHYPTGMEQTTLAPLRAGQKPDYQKTFGNRTNGNSGVLFAMELGRVAWLEGDSLVSRQAFEAAIAGSQAQDDKAAISASGAAAQGGAVLVNDKVIPYRAASFERTLVHHYQALNYLATNDLSGAGVEVRRANRVQEDAQRRREKEIDAAKTKTADTPPEEERDPNLQPVYAGLDEKAGSVKFSFQNAATFYLSGVVWEMLGEPNDAYIDYKRGLEIYPDNPYLQRNVLRLGRRLGMREDVEDFARRFPEAAEAASDAAPAQDRARLVVLFEDGLVIQKSEVSIAYPLFEAGSIGMIALPTYEQPVPPAVSAAVTVGGVNLGATAPICNVGALAARALQEQMPGILTRQVARAVTKGVAANAAQNNGGDLAEIVVLLYNVFSEQADLRSWLSLPAHIQVLDAWAAPGTASVALAAPGGGNAWSGEVTFAPGKTTIVVVSRIDLAVYSHVIMQP